jgi:hypothetical protein
MVRAAHFDSEWTLNGHDLMKVSRSEGHFSCAEFQLLKDSSHLARSA